jgi:hypothetical protein
MQGRNQEFNVAQVQLSAGQEYVPIALNPSKHAHLPLGIVQRVHTNG